MMDGWGVGGERVVCVTGLITLFFCVGGGGGSCDARVSEGCTSTVRYGCSGIWYHGRNLPWSMKSDVPGVCIRVIIKWSYSVTRVKKL